MVSIVSLLDPRVRLRTGRDWRFESARPARTAQAVPTGEDRTAATCAVRLESLRLRREGAVRFSYLQPIVTILRRMNAICVASGSSFGQTSWQASSDMQPNTPSSSPITS